MLSDESVIGKVGVEINVVCEVRRTHWYKKLIEAGLLFRFFHFSVGASMFSDIVGVLIQSAI